MTSIEYRCGEWVWTWDGDCRAYQVVGPDGDNVTLQTPRDGRLMFFNVPRTRVWRTRKSAEAAVRGKLLNEAAMRDFPNLDT